MIETRDTIIVSNRLPVTARMAGRRLLLERSGGGLVACLEDLQQRESTLWIGSLGGLRPDWSARLDAAGTKELHADGIRLVEIPQETYDAYYDDFANGAIWPLFHYSPERVRFTAESWQAYQTVNQLFADRVLAEAQPGARIWVHDYQLMLVPGLLRQSRPDLHIGFFLHVPFPAADLFRILPWREDVLKGLLGADLIGFQTLEYARHFFNSLARVLGLEPRLDQVDYAGRTVSYGAFPVGVNAEGLRQKACTAESLAHLHDLRTKFVGQKVLLGVDRLDYTKGVPERLEAFSQFLEENPEWVGRITMVQVAVPTREKVSEYKKTKGRVDALVGHINGRFGTAGHVPIHYVFRNLDMPYLLALYRLADVLMVTPIRDGLNLVCKEYVAAKGGEAGTVVLSEFAGAAAEMGGAIMVNPWNLRSLVDGIKQALRQSVDEAANIMVNLGERLARYDSLAWSSGFLESLDAAAAVNVSARQFGEPVIEDVIARIESSRRTFLFLDYDGTLVPIAPKPQLAVPTVEVMSVLDELTRNPRFLVTIASGRDRRFLERFLSSETCIVAEHGAWIRRPGESKGVHLIEHAVWLELQESVLGVMTDFERRVPGSTIEHKDFGLVWHYRLADPIFGRQQALVLGDSLGGMLQSTPYSVALAKKGVEVRPAMINKGVAVARVLGEQGFESGKDLILTIGDDRTDEDMFLVEAKDNISISLSDTPVRSSYQMRQPQVVPFLEALARGSEGARRAPTG